MVLQGSGSLMQFWKWCWREQEDGTLVCSYLCTKFTPVCAMSVASISCPCGHAWPQAALQFLVHLSGTPFCSAEQDENGDGARELRNMKSDRMKVLQMDVCSDQEVAQAVDFVKRTLKEPEEGM